MAFGSACASAPVTESYSNPPACAEVVERYRANPALAVDSLPKVRSISPPKTNAKHGSFRLLIRDTDEGASGRDLILIRAVILESGEIDAGSVAVSGDLRGEGAWVYEAALEEWRFIPARSGECFVPHRVVLHFQWGL